MTAPTAVVTCLKPRKATTSIFIAGVVASVAPWTELHVMVVWETDEVPTLGVAEVELCVRNLRRLGRRH